jgi:hypothetical protein
MHNILQEPSACINTPQGNDASVAMQWFASEVEGFSGMGSINSNTSAIQPGSQQVDLWVPDDTSAALLGIISQNETNPMSADFNDTSIAMSAFAPDMYEELFPPTAGLEFTANCYVGP